MRNEKQLIDAVMRRIPKSVHSQSMTSASLTSNGTPDRYFDGPKGDLWVEFKYIDAWPRSAVVGGVHASKRGCYSPLQYSWMKRRWDHGRNVLGVIGLPDGTAVVQDNPDDWLEGSTMFAKRPIQEVADCILDFTGY